MPPNEQTTLSGVFLVMRSLPDTIGEQAGKATFSCLLVVDNEWKENKVLRTLLPTPSVADLLGISDENVLWRKYYCSKSF